MKENAAKLVSAALTGTDGEQITVAGQSYVIPAPTIKRIAGAGLYLSDFGEEKTVTDAVHEFVLMDGWARALSWFINGDESLAEELSEGTLEEVLEGVDKAVSLIGVQNFPRLSLLARNVKEAIAKQR